MRTLLALILLLFCHLSLARTTLVIADIDDTLRATHRTADIWEQLQNVADPSLSFYGMLEVLKGFDQQKASIYYVSGTVAPVSELSAEFLSYNNYPQQENYMYRGWFESTKDFKMRVIEELIGQQRPEQVILLGDNGEYDAEVYGEIIKKHANATAYIHKLYGSDGVSVPSSQSVFLTGGDLAAQLYLQGYLTAPQALLAVDAVVAKVEMNHSYNDELVFPNWSDVSAKDIAYAFDVKQQWPEAVDALTIIEEYLTRDVPLLARTRSLPLNP